MVDPQLSAQDLMALRGQLALHRNARGVLSSHAQPVTHARIDAWLRARIDFEPDADSYIIRDGERWATLTVEDTPLIVEAMVEITTPGPIFRLDDARQVLSSWDALRCDDALLMWTRVPSAPTQQPLPARLSNRATTQLSPYLEMTSTDEFAIRIGETLHLVTHENVVQPAGPVLV